MGARAFHIVGRRRWNRRGAMVTDRYQHEHHHPDAASLAAWARLEGLTLVGVDNLPGSVPHRDLRPAPPVRARLRSGGPGPVRADARRVRGRAAHRAVRLDPLDQRRRRGGDRDARLGAPARLRPAGELSPGGRGRASATAPRRTPRRRVRRRRPTGRPGRRPRPTRRGGASAWSTAALARSMLGSAPVRSATSAASPSTRLAQPGRAATAPQGVEHDVGARVALGVEEVAEARHATALAQRPGHEQRRGRRRRRAGRARPPGRPRGAGRPSRRRRPTRQSCEAGTGRGGDPRGDRRGREPVVEQGDEQDPEHGDVGAGRRRATQCGQREAGEVEPRPDRGSRQRPRRASQRPAGSGSAAALTRSGSVSEAKGSAAASSCTATGIRRSRGRLPTGRPGPGAAGLRRLAAAPRSPARRPPLPRARAGRRPRRGDAAVEEVAVGLAAHRGGDAPEAQHRLRAARRTRRRGHGVDLGAVEEALLLAGSSLAPQQPAAHVRVERRTLDAESLRRLGRRDPGVRRVCRHVRLRC